MTETKIPPALGAIGVTPTYGAWYDRIVGKIIRWGTGTKDQYGRFHDSKVNHAVIYVGTVEGFDRPQLVQAQPGGASFADWDTYGSNMIWIPYPHQLTLHNTLEPLHISDLQRQLIASAAIECARKKIGYNYLDLLAVGLAQRRFHKLVDPIRLNALDRWIVTRLSKPDRLICSQLDDYVYEVVSIKLFADNRPSGLVSPADLLGLK